MSNLNDNFSSKNIKFIDIGVSLNAAELTMAALNRDFDERKTTWKHPVME